MKNFSQIAAATVSVAALTFLHPVGATAKTTLLDQAMKEIVQRSLHTCDPSRFEDGQQPEATRQTKTADFVTNMVDSGVPLKLVLASAEATLHGDHSTHASLDGEAARLRLSTAQSLNQGGVVICVSDSALRDTRVVGYDANRPNIVKALDQFLEPTYTRDSYFIELTNAMWAGANGPVISTANSTPSTSDATLRAFRAFEAIGNTTQPAPTFFAVSRGHGGAIVSYSIGADVGILNALGPVVRPEKVGALPKPTLSQP